MTAREMDLIDEATLSKEQMKLMCAFMYVHPYVQPSFDGCFPFSAAISNIASPYITLLHLHSHITSLLLTPNHCSSHHITAHNMISPHLTLHTRRFNVPHRSLPEPEADWDAFSQRISALNDSTPMVFNPVTRRMCKWIDMNALNRVYSVRGIGNASLPSCLVLIKSILSFHI